MTAKKIININDKMDTEKIVLMELYKQNGKIWVDHPNMEDTAQFEVYGFLDIYLKYLKNNLINEMEESK